MSRPSLILLGALAAALVIAPSAGAIVHGSFDGDAHPYVAIVGADDVFCTGELIAPRLLVTAGHCTAYFAQATGRTYVTLDPQARPDSAYVHGTAHTDPDFYDAPPRGTGLPASNRHDLGVVVLDEPLAPARFAQLPPVGALDRLDHGPVAVTLVGYGADGRHTGGGRPYPTFSFDRMAATSELMGAGTNIGAAYARVSTSPGGGDGGIGPGDSGSPALLAGTDVIAAIGSHGPSRDATGNTYSYRLDTTAAQAFIASF